MSAHIFQNFELKTFLKSDFIKTEKTMHTKILQNSQKKIQNISKM